MLNLLCDINHHQLKVYWMKFCYKNPDELIILPLFPHYAAATTGSVYKEVSRCLGEKWVIPNVTFINQFYDNPLFINAWVDKAKKFDINFIR